MDPALIPNQFYSFGAKRTLETFPWLDNWIYASPNYCLNSAGNPCVHGDGVATWRWNREAQAAINQPGDFSQATAGFQPIYRTDRKFPYVRFDGTDDFLRHASAQVGVSGGGCLAVAARWLGSATRTPFASCDEAGTAYGWYILDAGASPKIDLRFDNNQATDDRYAVFDTICSQRNYDGIWYFIGDGADWLCRSGDVVRPTAIVTGVDTGLMWGGVDNRDNWSLGCLYNSGGASSFCNFDLFEAIWLPTWTAERFAVIQQYFRTKYRYRTIAHLGDSWAADGGYGVEVRQALSDDWIIVHDHGVGSETISQIGARFDSNVDNKGYDLVIVEGAINDLKGVAAGGHVAVFTEFKRICDGVLADGSKLVACNCGPFGNNNQWSQTRQDETAAYNVKVRNYCEAKGVAFIDLYEFARNKDLAEQSGTINSSAAGQPYAFRPAWELAGGLHFNAVGDAYIARYIAEVVRKQLNSGA